MTKTTEIGTVIRPRRSVTLPARADGSPSAHTARACPTVRAGRAAACLLGRRRRQSRDSRHGRDVTRDLEGRRVGRVTGPDGSLTIGGDTTIVINDVRRPRRGNREHRLALTCCGLTRRAKRDHIEAFYSR